MSRWVARGLRTGIVSTRYPAQREEAPGICPGLPAPWSLSGNDGADLAAFCPTGALQCLDERVSFQARQCIHCFRCSRGSSTPMAWDRDFEWAKFAEGGQPFPPEFRRSLHVRVVDAGGCGACLNEIKLLNGPHYNIHRLGFFITPTPRTADVLLVVGPVTEHTRIPLEKAFQAVPRPRRVLAVGACALSGGIFGPGFMAGGGVAETIPVDVEVPGCPPPPLAILHGLLVLAGRKEPAREQALQESSTAPGGGQR